MKHMLRLLLILLLISTSALVNAQNFPKPVVLEKDVNFWLRVYTEIDTRHGFIHDARNLSVVYSTISVKGSPGANEQHVKDIKAKYEDILKTLAKGKRKNLSQDEKRVLEMWGGEQATSQRLASAANEIRFQRGQSNRFYEGLIRSGEWREYMKQVFLEQNMPVELAVLPHVESSFNPEAYSHVGAAGIWQFIRSTGRRYMQVDYLIDERMDPFASTHAAAKLLKHNYQLTQSWPLALTAYNHGVASMRRAINKLGTRDIATIVRKYQGRSFGFASRNFYVAFLAALKIDSDPEKYFGKINYAKPIEYDVVKLNDYFFATDIAEFLGVTKSQLERHNRALRKNIWNDTKRIPKNYQLRIPKDLLNTPAQQLIAAIPSDRRFDVQTPDLFHQVARGETVSEIANLYGFKVREIMAANGLSNGHYIRAGQKLRLPAKDKNGVIQLAATQPVQPVEHNKIVMAATESKIKTEIETINKDEPVEQISQEESLSVAEQDEKLQNKTSTDLDVSVVAKTETETEEVSLLTDPADYTVAADHTIEVQESETLGHYADWLDLRASNLRRINKMKFAQPVVVGNRLRLDFSEISVQEFESRRIAFQRNLQEQFFSKYRIESTCQHDIKNGESLWILALRKFKVPIWLLRQHNPDVDFDRIRPGARIVVPRLEETAENIATQTKAG